MKRITIKGRPLKEWIFIVFFAIGITGLLMIGAGILLGIIAAFIHFMNNVTN